VRGARNAYRFSFQDVVLLRTAYGLRAAHVPARRILRSLRKLRAALPQEVPLAGLRITAVGSEVAVQEGSARRQVVSGQLVFDFDGQAPAATVRVFGRPAKATEPVASAALEGDAEHWFRRAARLEATDKGEAEACYRRALSLAPDDAAAYLNLGVLLGELGRDTEAIELYRAGLEHCAGEALMHFNLAVALEDLARHAEAIEAYEACLKVAPELADAHYNAARLHGLLGHSRQAIRHYNAYRRLQR
jgi:tetratricopeptide (TPR) repeat protein